MLLRDRPISGARASRKFYRIALDPKAPPRYIECMRRAPILLVTLLALFAAATVVNAVQATTMSFEMSSAMAGDVGMGGCNDCGEEQGASVSCDAVCVPSLAGPVPTYGAATLLSIVRTGIPASIVPPGRTSVPDPLPPKSLS